MAPQAHPPVKGVVVLIVYLCLSEISPGVGEGESNNCGGVQRDELLLIRGRLSTRSSAMHPSDEQELIPTGEPQTAICHSMERGDCKAVRLPILY
jgi:hypothetical protein